jgi:hypothetical protein
MVLATVQFERLKTEAGRDAAPATSAIHNHWTTVRMGGLCFDAIAITSKLRANPTGNTLLRSHES